MGAPLNAQRPFAGALARLLVVLLLTACRAPKVEQRVLFIGNSYTSANNLAGIVEAMATARHHHIVVRAVAPGGQTLAQHAEAAETRAALAADVWTAVILQEQSVVPAVRASRERTMYPAVRELAEVVRARHARLLLFNTWARRDGMGQFGYPDFSSMQSAIDAAYAEIGAETEATVVPVGAAWTAARAAFPNLQLWIADGSHPTREGSYLAACLFYVTLFGGTPVGLPPMEGMDAATAHRLQLVAMSVTTAGSRP